MKYFDTGYFAEKTKRALIAKKRTIKNKIISWGLDKNYYDGKRVNGYGGYKYDSRWKKYLPKIIKKYKLNSNSKVLDIGCKKGFFLKDLKDLVPGIKIYGIENHSYPVKNAHSDVKGKLKIKEYYNLNFKNKYFDLVIGTTILKKSEWLILFKTIGYKGDYYFSTAKTLGLK